MSLLNQSPRRSAQNAARGANPRVGIIIPACDEAPCIAPVLAELLRSVEARDYVVAVGVNGSSDRTAEIARRFPVVVAETTERGYGHGCRAAIEALTAAHPTVAAFVFFAADGASDPRDVPALVSEFDRGCAMVLGARTGLTANWRTMTAPHVLANFSLALWAGSLTGHWFTDLAPLRLIERDLFRSMELREMTFGWTMEAQVGAAMLGARISEVPARERLRLAGEQKVSGVSFRRTLSIGCRIVAAGRRARVRFRRHDGAARREGELVTPSVVGL